MMSLLLSFDKYRLDSVILLFITEDWVLISYNISWRNNMYSYWQWLASSLECKGVGWRMRLLGEVGLGYILYKQSLNEHV